MWCPSCRADVAAELSSDNRRMLCARCRCELGVAAGATPQISITPVTAETERDARELLARWSATNLLEPAASSSTTSPFTNPKVATELLATRPDLRFDQPRSGVPSPSAPYLAAMIEKQNSPSIIPLGASEPREQNSHPATDRESVQVPQITDPANRGTPSMNASSQNQHAVEPQSSHDHDHVADAPPHPVRHRLGWSALAGQLCAYLGVGLLTCGSVLVMWSYFGGPPNYMPTGWLTAAVGQMLLFLGVITLVSSGMEQTITEVSWRIDHLAEEVHHMGLALDDLEHEHRQGRHHRMQTDRQHQGEDSRREAA